MVFARQSGANHGRHKNGKGCELVGRQREHLAAWQPDDLCTHKLRHLTVARRRSVNLRTRLSNQLKALLKSYFPQGLEICGEDLTAPMAGALLQKWPSLQQLKKARPETKSATSNHSEKAAHRCLTTSPSLTPLPHE